MKKSSAIIILLLMLSLCACGSKPQPTPTAAPTAVPTEVPTEVPAEVPTEVPAENPAEADAETNTAADAEPEAETFDPSNSGSVLRYYGAHADEIYGSYAFQQLDTEGKTVWTAPLAGISEFKVPEAFLNAKGGIRAGGGE